MDDLKEKIDRLKFELGLCTMPMTDDYNDLIKKIDDIAEIIKSGYVKKEDQIEVGPYLIRKHPPLPKTDIINVIWLEHEDGEGMTVDVDTLWEDF